MSDAKRMEQELAELRRQQGRAQAVEPTAEPTAWERKWAEMKQREREELEAQQRKPVNPIYRRRDYEPYQQTDWSRPLSSQFPKRRR